MRKKGLLYIRMRQEALMRKQRRRKSVLKAMHKNRKRQKTHRERPKQQFNVTLPPVEVFAPEIFAINNLERLIIFLNDTERQCIQDNTRSLKVNLNNVKQIDSYAISLMLSMLSRLSYRNIHYWGTYPDDNEAKNFILESGFLEVMTSNVKKPSNKRLANRIFMIGKERVDSHRIGQAVRESMAFVTGQEENYPPVYDDMLEISANSVEHANEKNQDKNWLVSISFEEDKVHYILTDTGAGILSTLKKKMSQKVKEAITAKGGPQILFDVFNKQYQSNTGEINRYKGLPIIYESFVEGFISDLMVVTNNVHYDFEKEISRELNHGYKGVLYSWTVKRENYKKWKNSL